MHRPCNSRVPAPRVNQALFLRPVQHLLASAAARSTRQPVWPAKPALLCWSYLHQALGGLRHSAAPQLCSSRPEPRPSYQLCSRCAAARPTAACKVPAQAPVAPLQIVRVLVESCVTCIMPRRHRSCRGIHGGAAPAAGRAVASAGAAASTSICGGAATARHRIWAHLHCWTRLHGEAPPGSGTCSSGLASSTPAEAKAEAPTKGSERCWTGCTCEAILMVLYLWCGAFRRSLWRSAFAPAACRLLFSVDQGSRVAACAAAAVGRAYLAYASTH